MSRFVFFSSNSCSSCFGQLCAHHQDLTTAWCYSLVIYMPWLREGCQDRLAVSVSNSFLLVAQHVSGNHVPIIRSWRLRDVIKLCWYLPWLHGGVQDRLAGSASTSLLLVAQHVSGNHLPIIRSWRLRDGIALCWYVPWLQEGCQDRLAGSASHFFSTSCSTCFGQPCAHHQELTTALFYSLVLVCAVAAGRFSRPFGL